MRGNHYSILALSNTSSKNSSSYQCPLFENILFCIMKVNRFVCTHLRNTLEQQDRFGFQTPLEHE